MSAELDKAFDDEVISLLEKRTIKEIYFEDGFFWSSVFAIPKKTGGFCPIFNLRRLNYHIFYEHFQMESLDSLRHLIQAGDWFTKIDLKDAYLTVPARECDQKFLCFSWRSRFYSFTSLPFGLSSAPRVFTKLCRLIAAYFRSRSIRLLVYLDDVLLMALSKDQAVEDFENEFFWRS